MDPNGDRLIPMFAPSAKDTSSWRRCAVSASDVSRDATEVSWFVNPVA
jgi:hypothetical protein